MTLFNCICPIIIARSCRWSGRGAGWTRLAIFRGAGWRVPLWKNLMVFMVHLLMAPSARVPLSTFFSTTRCGWPGLHQRRPRGNRLICWRTSACVVMFTLSAVTGYPVIVATPLVHKYELSGAAPVGQSWRGVSRSVSPYHSQNFQ